MCDRFALGSFRAGAGVAGGRSHDLYRVDTDRGAFAVKRMIARAQEPDFAARITAAYAIEKHAFVAGVPMPEPIPAPDTGQALARVAGSWWRVHRWVQAQPVEVPTVVDATDAGVLLAAIHRAGERRPDGTIATHTDLDPYNTLRVNGVLMAVDWDAAGWLDPAQEVVQVALDWSLEADRVDPDRFTAVTTAYRAAGGPGRLRPDKKLFAAWMRAYRQWLEFNLSERMDTELGRREAASTQARLTLVTAALDDVVSLLDVR